MSIPCWNNDLAPSGTVKKVPVVGGLKVAELVLELAPVVIVVFAVVR
jgi:hypothetical protein